MKTIETKAQHTPGPWRLDDGQIWGNEPSLEGADVLIADVAPGGVALTEFDIPNAKLIAAAPCLLEALQALCDICEDDDKYPLHTEQARAALAKAQGE